LILAVRVGLDKPQVPIGRNAKRCTATLLGPVGEPGEAWEPTSVAVPEEFTAARTRRSRTAESARKHEPGDAYSPFRHDTTLASGGAFALLVMQAKMGQAVALFGACPVCQVERSTGAQRVVSGMTSE